MHSKCSAEPNAYARHTLRTLRFGRRVRATPYEFMHKFAIAMYTVHARNTMDIIARARRCTPTATRHVILVNTKFENQTFVDAARRNSGNRNGSEMCIVAGNVAKHHTTSLRAFDCIEKLHT